MAERRTGAELRVVGGTRDLGSLREGRARLAAPPRAVVGGAEREEDLAPLRAQRSPRQRGLVVSRRVCVGERRRCLAGRRELPAGEAFAVGERAGAAQMTHDLCRPYRARGVALGEDLGQPRCSRARREGASPLVTVAATSACANA